MLKKYKVKLLKTEFKYLKMAKSHLNEPGLKIEPISLNSSQNLRTDIWTENLFFRHTDYSKDPIFQN